MPDDEVGTALEAMRTQKVHRLPVVDERGQLKGILSLNDVVLHADRKRGGVAPDEVVAALKGICEHRHLLVGAA